LLLSLFSLLLLGSSTAHAQSVSGGELAMVGSYYVESAQVGLGAVGVEGVTPNSLNPTYSPDGSKVAFVSDMLSSLDIWVIGVDGSELRRLSDFSMDVRDPVWSPDGSRIAFSTSRGGNPDIWTIQLDGSNPVQLTTGPSDDDQPSWSPDGSLIAFVSGPTGTNDLWTMTADGSNPRKVTNLSGQENHPSFSPDGTELVFSFTQTGVSNLMIINVDGTGLRRLTTGDVRDFYPNWSSNGIVFSSNRAGGFDLWLIQPDGSELQPIPNAVGYDPTWSPDGNVIAFSDLGPGGAQNIFLVNLVDETIQPLTQINGFFREIDIRPGVEPNSVNPKSTEIIPVTILTTSKAKGELINSDATRIDPLSVRFGPGLAPEAHGEGHIEDVDGDGDLDLLLHFRTTDTGIQCGDTEVTLTGVTFTRHHIQGSDTVVTVGCR